MNDLEQRLQEAAGPPARFPHDQVRTRVRTRRRRRAVVGTAAVAIVAAVGVTLPSGPTVDLQVGAGPEATAVDIDLADAPTRLPEGYQRCGNVLHERDVTVQRFCDGDDRLTVRFGPHDGLPEVGERVDDLRGRPVYVTLVDETQVVTISDRTSPDDRHYRVEAPTSIPTEALVDVVASIPAFAAATG